MEENASFPDDFRVSQAQSKAVQKRDDFSRKDLFEAAESYARAKRKVEEIDLIIKKLENCEQD